VVRRRMVFMTSLLSTLRARSGSVWIRALLRRRQLDQPRVGSR
jgi:hypothetical protein